MDWPCCVKGGIFSLKKVAQGSEQRKDSALEQLACGRVDDNRELILTQSHPVQWACCRAHHLIVA
jgi:hypothetical protein